tara:strand:- start:303 stop:1046 length:744 start_codon:yes stop_codon:yes gene_type:complete
VTGFLASVRNLSEAMLAYRIGVDWIDLKEPSAGALGAVDQQTVASVVEWLHSQSPEVSLSATIGDCWEYPLLMPTRVKNLHEAGVEYVKIGAFAHSLSIDFVQAINHCCSIGPRIILVCFAESPPTIDDIRTLATTAVSGVMLDTARKAGPSLMGLMSIKDLAGFVTEVHRHDLICGLAGSLVIDDVCCLSRLGADYLGFRGALCRNALRESGFSEFAAARVRDAIDRADKSNEVSNLLDLETNEER